MPEISLLEPRVLNGVVSSFLDDIGPELRGMNLIGAPQRDLNPVWEYDIIRGNRDVTSANAPNAEARRVDHIKYGVMTGSYIYLRDKKQFNPTTLRWLREPGNNEVTRGNAESMVMRELLDMDNRQKRFMEKTIWDMFKGTVSYTHEGGATISLNYGISSTHNPTLTKKWDSANTTTPDVIADVQTWKTLTVRDTGAPLTTAYMNSKTMAHFQARVAQSGGVAFTVLSDRQKEQYNTTGIVPNFLGISWVEYDGGYVDGETYTPYIPDGYVILLAPQNSPWGMKYGPTADDDAPMGTTGSFSKTWREPDPSNRQVLIERIFIPCLFRPDQVIYAKVYG